MISYEIFIIFFILVMAYFSYYYYRRKDLSKIGFIFWSCVWFFSLILVIFHSFFNPILEKISIMRVFDLYTILGFLFFLFIIFYLFKQYNKISNKLEELIRKLSLENSIKDLSTDTNKNDTKLK